MQTYSQVVDPTLSFDDLAGLGDRLRLPDGWSYRARVLDDELRIGRTLSAHEMSTPCGAGLLESLACCVASLAAFCPAGSDARSTDASSEVLSGDVADGGVWP